MSNKKFTPGPWKVSDRTRINEHGVSSLLIDNSNGSVEDIAEVYGSFMDGEIQANARLIAEAPAMYELLEGCAMIMAQLNYPETYKTIRDLLSRINAG